jgi:hypothetical protein
LLTAKDTSHSEARQIGSALRRAVVPDELWEEAARHYDESALAGLVVAIASINAWDRINASTRQITGEWVEQWISHTEPAAQAA